MQGGPGPRAGLGGQFWRMWVSTAGSALGDGLVLVAFPLLALSLTRRPILIAGVVVAGQLPAVVFSPLAGAVVDRYDRRRLATATEITRLAAFAVLAVAVGSGHDSVWLLYVTVAIAGCCQVVFLACTNAALPLLVGADDLERANGHLEAAILGGRELAGQGLGGVCFALARSIPFAVDAASFVLSAALVGVFVPSTSSERRTGPLRADIREGFAWFRRQPALRLLAWLIGAYAFCQSAVVAVLVLYTTGALHTGRGGFGLLMAIGSIGALGGSVASARITRRLGAFPTVVAGGALAGLAYLLLAARSSEWVAGAALSLECAGVALGNIASISLRQRLIPAELLGRVGTSFRMMLRGASVLGAAAGGVAASAISLRTLFAVAGGTQLVVITVAVRRRSRAARQGAEVAARY